MPKINNMQIIKKVLELQGEEYYKMHLSIINPLLPEHLTTKEIEVLAAFLSLDPVLIKDEVFNTLARKEVMEKLNLTPGSLGNHLGSLLKKKYLEKHPITHRIAIKKYLLPEEDWQGYHFKLVKV